MTNKIKLATPKVASISAVALGIALSGFAINSSVLAQNSDMTFFITSAGPGKGGDHGVWLM